MAETAHVVTSDFEGRKKVEHLATITLDGSGDGSVEVELDADFTNEPAMLVGEPLAANGTFTPTYTAGTPSDITIAVAGCTVYASLTIKVPLYAIEKG